MNTVNTDWPKGKHWALIVSDCIESQECILSVILDCDPVRKGEQDILEWNNQIGMQVAGTMEYTGISLDCIENNDITAFESKLCALTLYII